ncbi:MAG: ribonuclease E activity regulator RraA [Pseudomonadales bacterium]
MFSTPDICDEFPNDVHACELQFSSFGQNDRFSGQIETIKCFEDNSLVKQALAEPGQGRVLVVDGGGSLRRALLGDQIALSAVKHGWGGLVFNGAVRDVDDLNTLGIGVKALGCCPLKTEKRGEGQRAIDLHFGGIQFVAGHYLYADNNGVVVSRDNLLLHSG